jgi:D-3-phosphoglycerate dehydrogenase
VVGYGFIGKRLALLGRALGMQVLVSDPHARVAEPGIEQTSFDEVLARSDFVVCLAPATQQTVDLFSTAAFARMRPDACFINASRGELVDEDALLLALDTDVIAGAALDVGRAADQMPSPRVAVHPKIISTPHIGGLTPSATEHQAMDTVQQVRALVAGEFPAHAVNAEHAARISRLPGFSADFEGARS